MPALVLPFLPLITGSVFGSAAGATSAGVAGGLAGSLALSGEQQAQALQKKKKLKEQEKIREQRNQERLGRELRERRDKKTLEKAAIQRDLAKIRLGRLRGASPGVLGDIFSGSLGSAGKTSSASSPGASRVLGGTGNRKVGQ